MTVFTKIVKIHSNENIISIVAWLIENWCNSILNFIKSLLRPPNKKCLEDMQDIEQQWDIFCVKIVVTDLAEQWKKREIYLEEYKNL